MKKVFFLLTSAVLITASIQAQPKATPDNKMFERGAMIAPYSLSVGFYKTSVLIFPAPISSSGIDRGSSDIIAKPVPGVENILKVKASRDSFPQTNLTVVTTDGKLYSFIVDFSSNPPDQPIDLRKQQIEEEKIAFFKNRILNDEQIQRLATVVATQPSFLSQKAGSFKMRLALQGIYTCEDVICYRFDIKNKSSIDYTVDFPQFYIRDKKRVKRTAQQEEELAPLHIFYETGKTTTGKTSQTIVVVFSKFTIADNKNFVVQVFEKGGDRHLSIKIDGNQIVKARKINISTVKE